MAEVASAFVTLVPSAKGFGKGISSQIGGDVDTAGKTAGKRFGGGMSSGLTGVGAKLFAPLAAAGAAIGVGNFLKGAISEARESQKVGALTAQVIKSTGGAAKVTAGQVGDLATAISNKTGIDDEAIQSASNLLLTFTNVRNEVGKGNDIFNQATQAATDMGAALGGDPKSSAIQLGKALNDPVKGITALSKVGVSFTAQQKDQVKAMVKSGDTLGAQKLILGELNKEFGGAAAASATAGEKMGVAFGNFKESVGTALLPVIDKVANFLTAKIIPAMVAAIPKVTAFAKSIGVVFAALTGTGSKTGMVAKNLVPFVRVAAQARAVLAPLVNIVKTFFIALTGLGDKNKMVSASMLPVVRAALSVRAAFAQIVAFFRGQVIPAVMGIVTAVRGFIAVALPIVQAFVAGMMARIAPLMPQIRIIFATIGQIVTGYMGLVQAIISRVTTVISFIWSHWGSNIMDFVAKVFGSVITIIGGALKIVSGVIKLFTAIFKGDWSGAWAAIKQIVAGAWQVIKGVVSGALTIIKGVISGAGGLLKAAMSAVWGKVKEAVSAGIGKGVELVKGLPGKMVDALAGLGKLLFDAGAALIQKMIDGITSKIKDAGEAARKVADKIKGFFGGSPVEEGPLLGWNNGGVGKNLGGMLAAGLDASRSQVALASRGLAEAVALDGVGGAAMRGGGGGLSRADLQLLVSALERANLHPTISAGSVDRAVGGTLR